MLIAPTHLNQHSLELKPRRSISLGNSLARLPDRVAHAVQSGRRVLCRCRNRQLLEISVYQVRDSLLEHEQIANPKVEDIQCRFRFASTAPKHLREAEERGQAPARCFEPLDQLLSLGEPPPLDRDLPGNTPPR